MKKLLFVFALLLAGSFAVSSCKNKEKCEAYTSKISKTEAQKSY